LLQIINQKLLNSIKHNFIYYLLSLILFGCFESELIVNNNDQLLQNDRGIIYYDNVPLSGIVNSQYPDNKTKSKQTYKSGKLNGPYTEWYPNGEIRYSKNFKDGLQEGEQREWYWDGTLARTMKFQAGKQQGEQIGWKENGDLRFKYTYVNGKRYGFMGSTLCQPPEG
jgi:antitoxin component YwqK of YwqJK toxin-antitoxin module